MRHPRIPEARKAMLADVPSEAPDAQRQEALGLVRQSMICLMHVAWVLAEPGEGHDRVARAIRVARAADTATRAITPDLRAAMEIVAYIESVAAMEPGSEWMGWLPYWPTIDGRLTGKVVMAAIHAWRGTGNLRKWDAVAAVIRAAGLGRRSAESLHRQWKKHKKEAVGT